ncbi:hypothetical protein [Wenxinia marina]|uniref:Integral membrane protein n=1 Tax=Wenxinia marina DSM 24838 TaxID=1123501 RepID=A0A0D0QEI7_9RHOB|nr:hypothetical protein [Wenxinia marina]KIQ70742.1 hypothetical protein Wenmar_00625 [Wenxinia marina DSM 24838]GGL80493.1 hypothetical protein GCM10011392_38890 [Wenxinia marina]
MKRTFAALAALAVAPGLAAAQVADGLYEIGQCAGVSDAQARLSGSVIEFWESRCDLTVPVNVRDMGGATLYDAVCTGEGQEWSRRMLLMQGPDGRLVVVQAGFATTYQRCD